MKNKILLMVFLLLTILIFVCFADNPIVTNIYTSDPAPMVHNGRCYVYTGHDEDVIIGDFFTMNDYRCYSTQDMINWTDHGSPLSYTKFSWATGDAWAAQCVYRNGTFYYYVTMTRSGGARCIGVAVSDSPTGPFTDPLGRPLIANNGAQDIDPTVFIDDDGQAYLFWGNPNLYYVRLNQDMISYSGGIVQVSSKPSNYQEGPWVYKRNGIYYLVYATTCCSEAIGYATSSSPTGAWTYRGIIMPVQGGSFTNHPGVVDFNGGSFFFYHNAALPGGGGYHRSVCVEEFKYNADGTFPTINMTTSGVSGEPRTPVPGDTPIPTPDPTPDQTTAPTDPPSPDPVFSGGPYTLNGTSDYVDLPDGLTSGLNDFSVACWVRLNSLDTWTRIFDFGGDTNVFMMLTPASGNTGYPYFCITLTGNDEEQGLDGTSALSTGSWQHIAVVRNGNTGTLYINNQQVDTNSNMTLNPADMGNTTNNYIGRSQWSNDPYLNADIDKFYVYNRALSASEVTDIYNDNPDSTPSPTPGTVDHGDVNGDGSIDIVDALLIAQYYVGLDPANFIPGNADTNCDGSIDIVDALLVAQYYVGLIQGFC